MIVLPCTDNQPFNFDTNLPSNNHTRDPPSTFYNAQSKPTLSTLTINFQSIVAKQSYLHCLLNEQKPDIIFGCETWLSPSIQTSNFFPASYNVFRHDRDDGYEGVLLAVCNGLTCKVLPLPTNCEAVACELTINDNNKLILCAFYRPPTSNLMYLENLCSFFSDLVKQNFNVPIWISGDLNLPNINWETNTVTGYNYPTILCDVILDFVENYGFLQIVNIPTRCNHILDVFLTNRPTLIQSCEVLPGISDHEVVHVASSVLVSYYRPKPRRILLWHKADFELIKNHILNISSDIMSKFTTSTPINLLWNEFKALCESCLNLVPCRKASTRFGPPWLKNGCPGGNRDFIILLGNQAKTVTGWCTVN